VRFSHCDGAGVRNEVRDDCPAAVVGTAADATMSPLDSSEDRLAGRATAGVGFFFLALRDGGLELVDCVL
jgi:hypothetical protein